MFVLLSVDTLIDQICGIFLTYLEGITSRYTLLLLLTLAVVLFPPNNHDLNETQTASGYKTWLVVWKGVEHLGSKIMGSLDQATKDWKGRRLKRPSSIRSSPPRRYSSRLLRLYVTAVIAMDAGIKERSVSQVDPFDTDSETVGIDNRASGCITHVRSDIPGEVKVCHRAVKGFGGSRQFNVYTGTIVWRVHDDIGVEHEFVIKNGFYIPDGKVRLLSPQHWAQNRKGKDKGGGAGERTTAVETVLFWNDGQDHLTIPLNRDASNVASF
jgi:hypothetical protein